MKITTDEIKKSAFKDRNDIKEIEVQEDVKRISENCFADCKALERITLPKSLVSIRTGAFSGCSSLKFIEIPEGVKYIDKNVFSDCVSLETVSFLNKNIRISLQAFTNCLKLDNDSLAFIASKTFKEEIQYVNIRKNDMVSKLANLYPRQFMFDGVLCSSVESVLQSFWVENINEQKRICTLDGYMARSAIQDREYLYWQGQRYDRYSKEYQYLLNRLYETVYAQDEEYRYALLLNRGCRYDTKMNINPDTHSITHNEYCERLYLLGMNFGFLTDFQTDLTAEKQKYADSVVKKDNITKRLAEQFSEDAITSFRKHYDYLSNFYPARVIVDGMTFCNSESAYQAAKCANEEDKKWFVVSSSDEAKRKKFPVRDDWDSIKIDVMKKVVFAKFTQNPHLATYLMNTGNVQIVEGNTWGDVFWGIDIKTGEGENHLGKILMELRKQFQTNGIPENPIKKNYIEFVSNDGISVQLRDIVTYDGDCIVNATNENMSCKSTLNYAMCRAGGEMLSHFCSETKELEVTETKITPGFELPSKYIIHTVGPHYGVKKDSELLEQTYTNILDMAKENDIHSIAFPLISTGSFSYPKKVASEIAVNAIRKWKKGNSNYAIDIVLSVVDLRLYDCVCETLKI